MMTTRRELAAGLAGAAAFVGASANAQVNPADPNAATSRVMNAAQSDAAMNPESTFNGAPREIIPIWPYRPPGMPRRAPPQEVIERSSPPALRDRAVLHVARPVLIVFRPTQPIGAAIVMCTGGSYVRVVLDKEGFESAELFARQGITTFQLIYRLPGDHYAAGVDAALQDVQRAIRLVRSRAAEFSIDPARVAVMGFSAGGHVAAGATLRFDAPVYERVDAADDLSAKPDISVLMYPVITMEAPHAQSDIRTLVLGGAATDAEARAHSMNHFARADAPPTFLLHCSDDATIPVGNSLLLYEALRAQNVPAELHVFETGGHGFGTRLTTGKPTAIWPDLVQNWLRARGVIPA
jgi:acetyl esterase/lipase